jgi:hypothetical protein
MTTTYQQLKDRSTKHKQPWEGKVIRKKTDANPKGMATFYKAIFQSILLYELDNK